MNYFLTSLFSYVFRRKSSVFVASSNYLGERIRLPVSAFVHLLLIYLIVFFLLMHFIVFGYYNLIFDLKQSVQIIINKFPKFHYYYYYYGIYIWSVLLLINVRRMYTEVVIWLNFCEVLIILLLTPIFPVFILNIRDFKLYYLN